MGWIECNHLKNQRRKFKWAIKATLNQNKKIISWRLRKNTFKIQNFIKLKWKNGKEFERK